MKAVPYCDIGKGEGRKRGKGGGQPTVRSLMGLRRGSHGSLMAHAEQFCWRAERGAGGEQGCLHADGRSELVVELVRV